MHIVLIICGTLVALFLIAAIFGKSKADNTPGRACYFRDAFADLSGTGQSGDTFGQEDCVGDSEYIYMPPSQSFEATRALHGARVCPVHVRAFHDLIERLERQPGGFWLLPKP